MQRERRHNARLAFNVTVNAHLVNRVIMVNNDIGQCEWIIEEVARGGVLWKLQLYIGPRQGGDHGN